MSETHFPYYYHKLEEKSQHKEEHGYCRICEKNKGFGSNSSNLYGSCMLCGYLASKDQSLMQHQNDHHHNHYNHHPSNQQLSQSSKTMCQSCKFCKGKLNESHQFGESIQPNSNSQSINNNNHNLTQLQNPNSIPFEGSKPQNSMNYSLQSGIPSQQNQQMNGSQVTGIQGFNGFAQNQNGSSFITFIPNATYLGNGAMMNQMMGQTNGVYVAYNSNQISRVLQANEMSQNGMVGMNGEISVQLGSNGMQNYQQGSGLGGNGGNGMQNQLLSQNNEIGNLNANMNVNGLPQGIQSKSQINPQQEGFHKHLDNIQCSICKRMRQNLYKQ